MELKLNLYNFTYFVILLGVINTQTAWCVMIRNPPSNLTVLKGSDARFNCEIIEKRAIDYVFWKKLTDTGSTAVLTYNEISTNKTKYVIHDYYSITIKDVDLDDEAWYECQAGVDRSRAKLTVNVMMDNLTLVWGSTPPFAYDALVNLTCRVHHSRPPADVTWFHGNTELTSISSTCQKTSCEDGFGDTVSTLTVAVRPDKDNLPYTCVATLPGSDIRRTEVVYATRIGGLTSKCDRSFPDVMFVVYTVCLTIFISLQSKCDRSFPDVMFVVYTVSLTIFISLQCKSSFM